MIGIVADDITGANDIGIMYAKSGLNTYVVSPYTAIDVVKDQLRDADVLILDTNSRADEPNVAYTKVHEATDLVRTYSCDLYIKKTCSVFRGNIGTEFDAMLDALNERFAVVVAAFPKNGRTTRDGFHAVHGIPLAESAFVKDPIHPTTENSLLKVLATQTSRQIDLLPLKIVRDGVGATRNAVQLAERNGGYLICDAESQADLRILAEAFQNQRCVFGASGISEEIAAFRRGSGTPETAAFSAAGYDRTLLVSGSVTPQTRAQISAVVEAGIPTVKIETLRLFADDVHQYVQSLVDRVAEHLTSGVVLLYAANDETSIKTTIEAARKIGIQGTNVNRGVSDALSMIAKDAYGRVPFNQLIIAGGETSNHVCSELGIVGNRVLYEIQPGLPVGLSLGNKQIYVVLKSGSFGSPNFLLEALRAVHAAAHGLTPPDPGCAAIKMEK